MTSAAAGDGAGRLTERLVHEGRIVRLSVDTVRMPDGSVAERELVRHVGASAIVPIVGDPKAPDPDVVLIRQWRYTTDGEILEIPAGMRDDPDESFEQCARRELREETGYTAGRLAPLTPIWTTPGFTNERVHLFAAWDLGEGPRDLDSDEFLELVRVPLSTAMSWVGSGRITDAKTVAGLLWVAHFGIPDSPR